MKSIKSTMPESALGASERGSMDGPEDDGLRACHETARMRAAVRRASALSSTSSVHQFNRNRGLEAKKRESGLTNSDEPCRGARPRPGRSCPRPPHQPLSDLRAPENTYESGMKGGARPPCARHSAVTADSGTTSRERRPCCHASRDLPGRWGHSSPGEESPPRLSDPPPLPRGSRTRRYRAGGGGDNKNPIIDRTSSPLFPQRAQGALIGLLGI